VRTSVARLARDGWLAPGAPAAAASTASRAPEPSALRKRPDASTARVLRCGTGSGRSCRACGKAAPRAGARGPEVARLRQLNPSCSPIPAAPRTGRSWLRNVRGPEDALLLHGISTDLGNDRRLATRGWDLKDLAALPPLRREFRAGRVAPRSRHALPRHRVSDPHAPDPRISQDSPARSAAAAGAVAVELGGCQGLRGVPPPVCAGVSRSRELLSVTAHQLHRPLPPQTPRHTHASAASRGAEAPPPSCHPERC